MKLLIALSLVTRLAFAGSETFDMAYWVQNGSYTGSATILASEGSAPENATASIHLKVLSENEIEAMYEIINEYSALAYFRLRFTPVGSVELLHYDLKTNGFVVEGTGSCSGMVCNVHVEHLVENDPSTTEDDELMISDKTITKTESSFEILDVTSYMGLTHTLEISTTAVER